MRALRCLAALPPALLLALLPDGPARAEVFLLDGDADLVGADGEVLALREETLTDIARRHGLGYYDLVQANPGVDPWLPGESTPVRLPTRYVLPDAERHGVVVNIAEYRMYYYTRAGGRDVVATFPVSIGRMDWSTPLGASRIVAKARNPAWYPPQSVLAEYAAEGRKLERVVPPGPDNPLGDFALRLSIPGYLIHGTNRPAGVGMQVTHGCLRMYPEDIEWLFERVDVNTRVRIVNQPVKLGWQGDELYLESHPPLTAGEGDKPFDMTDVMQMYVRATERRAAEVDWALLERAYAEQAGIPVMVGRARDAAPQLAAAE